MIKQMPNTFRALTQAIVDSTAYANKAENRKDVADVISAQNYLNQPQTVVEQALTGTYADGLGGDQARAGPGELRPVPLRAPWPCGS